MLQVPTDAASMQSIMAPVGGLILHVFPGPLMEAVPWVIEVRRKFRN